jgi:hypothetical protein
MPVPINKSGYYTGISSPEPFLTAQAGFVILRLIHFPRIKQNLQFRDHAKTGITNPLRAAVPML